MGLMLLDHDSYQSFLQEEFARRMEANRRYSQRAFARDLRLSAGELSEILKGKRKLSLKSALKVVQVLGLNQTEARHLAYLVQLEKSRDLGSEQLLSVAKDKLGQFTEDRQLTMDRFRIVSDWYCFAILNLSETDGFKWHTAWIAKRLAISSAEVKIAVRRLERVGLIYRDENSRLKVSKETIWSPDGVPSEAIRNYHRQMLSKAVQALEVQPVTEREFAGVGFPIDPKDMASLKIELNTFIDTLVAKYAKSPRQKKEVYHLEMALFRLTQGESNVH